MSGTTNSQYSGALCSFSYNGTDSSVYHVEYVPNQNDRWFQGPDWEVYEADINWKNGGYYYGNSAKIRTFQIKCYFEEITIKQREDIRKWLHRDTSGRLIFSNMPFVYWNVRPTRLVNGELYIDGDYYSGTFTVTFSAYEPFGYLMRKSNGQSDNDNANDYCDLISTSSMPAAPTTSSRSFQVYNPGREVCGMSISVSGSVSHPIEFLNTTNSTSCVLQSLPSSSLILEINGETGLVTTHTSGSTSYEYGFAYHDRGYVKLNPGYNTIQILEQNNSGGWVTPTTLTLTSIAIDYAPRIL